MKEELEELLKVHLGWTPDSRETEYSLAAFAEAVDNLYLDEKLESLEVRRQKFLDSLRPHLDEYGSKMLNNFSKFWLEKSPKGRKFKFEFQKVFNTKGRLATWAKNQEKFSIVNMLKKQGNYER